ncbi:MAG: hypothetical protein ACYC6B_08105 [Thermoleophilia bacterium]
MSALELKVPPDIVALILPAAFMFYMNRLQIGPEERTLSALLGRDYSDYLRQVRRWF